VSHGIACLPQQLLGTAGDITGASGESEREQLLAREQAAMPQLRQPTG